MDTDKMMAMAEEAAYAACPPDIVKTLHGEFDANLYARIFFVKGYERALKDMAEGDPEK